LFKITRLLGTHAELLAKENGVYASLVKAQQFQSTSSSNVDHTKATNDPVIRRNVSFASNYSSIRDYTKKEFTSVEKPPASSSLCSGGLIRLYAHNCTGHYLKMLGGTICSLLRGLELPLYVLLMNIAFTAFQDLNVSLEVYRSKLLWFVTASCVIGRERVGVFKFKCLGVYSMLVIFGSVSLYGWATEEITDMLKVRALRNVLRQGAEYFDRPETVNAKLLQRITNDSTTMKAALDIRLYHIVNNVFCCFVEIIVAFVFCWEISLVGLALYCILFAILGWLSKGSRVGLEKIAELDDSAKSAVEIIENTRTIQLLTCESYFQTKFNETLKRFAGWEKKVSLNDSISFALNQSFYFFSDSCCYSMGIYLIYHGMQGTSDVFV
jgi:ATP-binding cassette subfamily B (MDR/TAP) protein 1